MKSVVLRTGMYLYSLARSSAPSSVRGTPHDVPVDGKSAKAVDAEDVEVAVLGVGQGDFERLDAENPDSGPGGGLPDSPIFVGLGVKSSHRATGGGSSTVGSAGADQGQ